MWWVPKGWAGNVLENRPFGKCQLSQPPKVWAGNVLSIKSLGRKCPERQKSGHEMSWTPKVWAWNVLDNGPFGKRQISMPPKVWTGNILRANCPYHQMSCARNFPAANCLTTKSPYAKCRGQEMSQAQKIQAPIVRNAECQTGNVLGRNCPSCQMSQAPIVWSAKFPGAKCPSAKTLKTHTFMYLPIYVVSHSVANFYFPLPLCIHTFIYSDVM